MGPYANYGSSRLRYMDDRVSYVAWRDENPLAGTTHCNDKPGHVNEPIVSLHAEVELSAKIENILYLQGWYGTSWAES